MTYQKESRLGFKFSPNSIIDDSSYIDFSDSKIYKVESLTLEKIIEKQDFIDLGLPSGIKWAKCNLGATCENTISSWYGNYYAWGETQTKRRYTEEHYKWLQKYKTYSEYKKYAWHDDKIFLDREDDVVYQYYLNMYNYQKDKFRMPNKQECQELLDDTTIIYQKDYNNIMGLNGISLISKFNHKEIFIPAAGYINNNLKTNCTVECNFWTNQADDCNHDAIYVFGMRNFIEFKNDDRYFGMPVRAICEK